MESTSKGPPPTPSFFIVAMFLVGIGLSWVLYCMVEAQIAFLGNAQSAQGEVVRMKEGLSSGRLQTPVLAPVFRFTTADGQTVETVAAEGGNHPVWAVGDTGRVLYDPAQPSHATVDTFWGRWGPLMVLAFVTLSFFAGSTLGLRTRGWRLF